MARLTGNTLRTVRFYEEAGILRPDRRSAGGHRLFSQHELERLQPSLTTDEGEDQGLEDRQASTTQDVGLGQRAIGQLHHQRLGDRGPTRAGPRSEGQLAGGDRAQERQQVGVRIVVTCSQRREPPPDLVGWPRAQVTGHVESGEQPCLHHGVHRAVGGVHQVLRTAVGTSCGVEPPGRVEAVAEGDGNRDRRVGVRRVAQGVPEVIQRAVHAGSSLRRAELDEHPHAGGRGDRQLQRRGQQLDRPRRRRTLHGRCRAASQHVHRPLLVDRGGPQQVGGNIGIAGGQVVQHACSPRVQAPASGRSQVLQHRFAHDRVHEGGNGAGGQQPGGAQPVQRRGHPVLGESGDRRDHPGRGHGAQRRDRRGNSCGIGTDPAELDEDGVAHPGGTEIVQVLGRVVVRDDPLVADRRDQLSTQERVPADGLDDGRHEGRARVRQPALGQGVDRLGGQRCQRYCPACDRQVGEEPRDLHRRRFPAAGRDEQRDRQVLESGQQVAQPAQALWIGPLGVVHHDEEGLELRQVRHRPVQPVEAWMGIGVRCRQRRAVEQRRRKRRRPLQHPRAFVPVEAFQQLDGHTPGEPALEVEATSGQHPEAALACFGRHHVGDGGLAGPCDPLDQHARPRATRCPVQGGVHDVEHVIAFEQERRGRTPLPRPCRLRR